MPDTSTALQNPAIFNPPPTGTITNPNPPEDTINENAQTTSSIGQWCFPNEELKYYMSFGISEWNFGAGSSSRPGPGELDTTNSIRLPLPDSLKDLQSVNWDKTNLLGDTFKAAGGILGGLALLGKSGVNVTTEQATGRLVRGGAAAGILGGAGLAVGTVTRLLGYAPNQFITVLLNSPEYKQHQFSWNLAPKNAIEAKQLKNIIQVFNNAMAPGLAAGKAFWTFPSIFWLSFVPNPDYLFRFKPAILTNFMVDYSGGHVPSFLRSDGATNNDNPPEAVTLVMSFLEIEYWKRGDFRDGGYATATPASLAAEVNPANIPGADVQGDVNNQIPNIE